MVRPIPMLLQYHSYCSLLNRMSHKLTKMKCHRRIYWCVTLCLYCGLCSFSSNVTSSSLSLEGLVLTLSLYFRRSSNIYKNFLVRITPPAWSPNITVHTIPECLICVPRPLFLSFIACRLACMMLDNQL